MAPSVSKEELMRNSDHLVWGLSAGSCSPVREPKRLCERIWVFLNSRTCNITVVFLVIVEGLVILSELLITLQVVRDPAWNVPLTNCTFNNTVVPVADSPKLTSTKDVLSYISMVILTIFLMEITLRAVCGKLRYLLQGVEVFDAVIVIMVFGLNAAYMASPPKAGSWKEAAILLILLRLWRFKRVARSIIDNAKVELNHITNRYQREKTQAEHKVDILILKVEDLEHEVAYLKEKLKKTEKDSVVVRKRRSKESSHSRNSTVTVGVETSPLKCPSMGTQTLEDSGIISDDESEVHIFAEKIAAAVLTAAFNTLTYTKVQIVNEEKPSKAGAKLHRRPDGSLESGYGSGCNTINWERLRANVRSGDDKLLGLRCPESSPESGYGSSISAAQPRTSCTSPVDTEVDVSSGSAKNTETVFLFPDSPTARTAELDGIKLQWLDEQSEIERVKRVEFDPHLKDQGIPMTSL